MLTRDRIDEFAELANGLHERYFDCLPRWLRSSGLVEETPSSRHGSGMSRLTQRGEDLLATIPHFPKPEPEPEPTCERCGDAREVPLFMGPAMMPCPLCRPEPERQVIAGVDPGVEAGTGWVLIDSEATAARFYGTSAQLRANAGTPAYGAHPRNGDVVTILEHKNPACRDHAFGIEGPDEDDVSWGSRGNVYLRPAPSAASGSGWVHINSQAVAQTFVGKNVEILAPKCSAWDQHDHHLKVRRLASADADGLYFANDGILWRCRGNVCLRLVPE